MSDNAQDPLHEDHPEAKPAADASPAPAPEPVAADQPEKDPPMEVHHHAHHDHGKKNWKSYFWEFLMLFLAVFCGFLAENQREHLIEHQRETKYMQRVYKDLQKDTAFYRDYSNYLAETYALMDTMIYLLNDDHYLQRPDRLYELAPQAGRTRFFEFYNTAFDQMKSSGNLRLIRQEKILDSLLDYHYTLEKRITIIDSRTREAVTELNMAIWSILDAGQYLNAPLTDRRSVRDLKTVPNPSLPDVPKMDIIRVKNLCFNRKISIINQRSFLLTLDAKAQRMLKEIADKYPLDEE